MLVVLSGGGTAGHINPALALAEVLLDRGHEVYFAGTPDGVEAGLVGKAGIPFSPFEAKGFDRAHPATLVSAVSKTAKSTSAAKRWLSDLAPDAVVCFGGYVCIPVGRAAKALGIPVVVHEQNSVMGLANKYLAKQAAALALTYAEAAEGVNTKARIVVTGNPVRSSVLEATRAEGRRLLDVPDGSTLLLVFGGSQGARHINEAVVALKDTLLSRPKLAIAHVAGPRELDGVVEALALDAEEQKRWKVFGYYDDMGALLAASDMVLARAGATSLAEISARQVPALLVPFPYATDDHQTTNAKSLVERGAASMVADDRLGTPVFAEKLFEMIDDPRLRASMRERAAGLGAADAASRLADVVEAPGMGA